MTNEATTGRIKREFHDVLDSMRDDLDRIELLAITMSAFSRPIPDYEPRFRHLNRAALNAQELGKAASRK
ncbi:MAG: hypothetical protein WA743_01780 [Pseudolabrys sp.]|jgi:hypothetical protein